MAADGTVSRFTAPGYDIVEGMVLGTDGSIWVAGYYDELFHIQQDGTETVVALPAIDGLGCLDGLAEDGDGTFWLSVNRTGSSSIAHVDASGSLLADDPLPVQDGGTGSPMSLALGAGRVLWFALAYTGDMPAYLGKLDTASGQVTQYPVSLAGEGGNGYLVAAPDGTVFMNEYANDKIARVTADGTFCEIDVPTPTAGTPAAGQVSMHLHETYDAAGRRTMLTCARGNSAHKRQRSQRHINTPTHYAKTEP